VHVPADACVEACTRSHTNVLILSNHVVLTRGSNISFEHIRGVIVVSMVSGEGEVCIAYTLALVSLLDPKHVLGYWYEYCSVD